MFLKQRLSRTHNLTFLCAGDEFWPGHVGCVLLGRLRLALRLPLLPGRVPARGQREVCGRGGRGRRDPQGRGHRGQGLQVQLQLGGAGPGRGHQPPALPASQHLVLVAVSGTGPVILPSRSYSRNKLNE